MKKIIISILALIVLAMPALASDLPDMPVKITYRKALLTNGAYVLQFHNLSENLVPILVTLENPATDTKKTYRLNLQPFKMMEIGSLQGWTALPGDKIIVENSNFNPLHDKIPNP